MLNETLAQRNARYIREGRTVSGGDADPKGKPGTVALAFFIEGGDQQLLQKVITLLQGEGFTVGEQTATGVLLERGYDNK